MGDSQDRKINITTNNTWHTLLETDEPLRGSFILRFSDLGDRLVVCDVSVGPVGAEEVIVRNLVGCEPDPTIMRTFLQDIPERRRIALRARYRRPPMGKGPKELTFGVSIVLLEE